LYDALIPSTTIARTRAVGKHVLVAGVDGGNDASIRLHEKLGFVVTARMPEVGREFDRWLDLVYLQLLLEP
jgi:phosphinothricin acetyltransferase